MNRPLGELSAALCQLTSRARNSFGHVIFATVNIEKAFPSSVTFLYENTGSGHITANLLCLAVEFG